LLRARSQELRKKKNIKELRLRKQMAAAQDKAKADRAKAPELKRGKAADAAGRRRSTSEQTKVLARQKSLEEMAKKKKRAAKASESEEEEEEEEDASEGSEGSEEDDDVDFGQRSRRGKRDSRQGRGDDDEANDGGKDDDDEGDGMGRGNDSSNAKDRSGGSKRSGDLVDEDEWPDEAKGGLTLTDVNKTRLPRRFLEEKLEEPYLAKAIKGCFVRYLIGSYQVHRGGSFGGALRWFVRWRVHRCAGVTWWVRGARCGVVREARI